ncbi:MAG: hypothetical protein NT018_07195 [Armatimonadetes bacterium]|nr:hypothetical protein [Armatimonadota bacterium]
MISNRAGVRYMAGATAILFIASVGPAVAEIDMFASDVVNAVGLGESPYNDALAVLGKPTLKFKEPNGNVFASSLVAGPWNTDLAGSPIITTIESGGELTAVFATPIEDDPSNWYGMDFIVFGNAAFNGSTGIYITPTTNMETYRISSTASGRWEKSVVSVSQDANGPWYTYTTGPYADDFAPTQAYAWDYINDTWGAEMDLTKPVDPALTTASFISKYAADAIDMYKSSGGGTAFNLDSLNLPVNAAGRKWIKYIKITGNGGELDAISRVGHTIEPISIGQAKSLPDGTRVILTEQIVSAGTDDFGDCCYLQTKNMPFAIKVTGRIVERDKKVNVEGVMTTVNGEREIQATCMEIINEPTP